jgi:hypothetical protein
MKAEPPVVRPLPNPITAGLTYNIVFAIWDSTDDIIDSTVLFDNCHWTFN